MGRAKLIFGGYEIVKNADISNGINDKAEI